MTEDPFNRIYQLIESDWAESGAWPDFVEIMRQGLAVKRVKSTDGDQGLTRLTLLPGLCCQAAGGDPLWADDVAAAWFLFYAAAHIMDSIEDQDQPDPWWADLGRGAAINAATGLYFSASLALNNLLKHAATRASATEVITDFNHNFLVMCSGQYRDLVSPMPTLEQYWENAAAKSGAFFSLACRSGARLATDDALRVRMFSRFGHHIGLLVQILDDLEDMHPVQRLDLPGRQPELGHSLAVVYALSVYPPPEQARLRDLLATARHDLGAAQEALTLIDQSGAALYMAAEIERHHRQAVEALEQAAPQPPAGEALLTLLQKLNPQ